MTSVRVNFSAFGRRAAYHIGIGLLELMLALSVIGLLLLTATRYYATVHANRQTNEAVELLTAIMGAVDQWEWLYKDSPAVSINLKALMDQGLLPQRFSSDNPWGGALAIGYATAGVTKITLTDVPHGSCLNLKDIMATHRMEVDCQGTTFVGSYPVHVSSARILYGAERS